MKILHLRWRDHGSIGRDHPLGVNRTSCGIVLAANVHVARTKHQATCPACRNEAGLPPLRKENA